MFSSPAFASDASGRVIRAEGGVYAIRDSARLNLAVDSDVFEFDILETGESGSATVRFADDSLLELGKNTRINVKEAAFSGDRQRFNVGITNGTARVVTGALVKRKPGGVKVTTPKSTIGIRGTTLAFEVTANYEKVTVVELSEGSVVTHMRTDNGAITTMTAPYDSVQVSTSTTTNPVTGVTTTTTDVQTEGAGVKTGAWDSEGERNKDGSGVGVSEPGATTGSDSGHNDNPGVENTPGDSTNPGSDGSDCCNDNSSPGRR
jgi:hypothetical protein